MAGPGQVAVAFWARSEAEGWACSGGSRAAESSNLPGSPRSPRHTMASGGSQSCEEEEEEEALKKLIVRLNNVQEGKQMDTLLQLLEDMLVFTYSDRGTAGSPSLLCKLYPALGVLILGIPLLSFREEGSGILGRSKGCCGL